jgi:hypothetical protein
MQDRDRLSAQAGQLGELRDGSNDALPRAAAADERREHLRWDGENELVDVFRPVLSVADPRVRPGIEAHSLKRDLGHAPVVVRDACHLYLANDFDAPVVQRSRERADYLLEG